MSLADDDTVGPTPAPDMGEPEPDAPEDPTGLGALIGRTLARRYRVDALLGQGGMGAVYRGLHLGLNREIAIKVLRPELTSHPDIAPRFQREAQASSRLEHPNVVQVFDFGGEQPEGFDREIKFLVMQLLQGRELSDMLGQPIPPTRALELLRQILSGLAHAHERGVVHRDLKPDNVFVTTDHEDRELLKLVDFGIAKLADGPGEGANLTQTGMVFGTPTYMSPEQATGSAKVDARTDLYAAGIILYEMLAGKPPFAADELVMLLRKQVLEPPPPLPGLGPALEQLLFGLLAKRQDERIQTAADALDLLTKAERELRDGPEVTPASRALAQTAFVAAGGTVHSPAAPSPATDSAASPRPRLSTSMDLVAQTLAPLAPPPAESPMRKWWLAGAAGVGSLVVMLALAPLFIDDGDDSDPREASAAEVMVAEASQVVRDLEKAVGLRATDDELTHLDGLLAGKDDKAAKEALQSLLDQYPKDGRLHWRRAKRLAGKDEKEMAAAYRRALELEPSLIDDKHVYADLSGRLGSRQISSALIDAVADHVGSRMRPVLVELVNRDEHALPYQDRHRLLAVLLRDDEASDLVQMPLQDALDLWQAHQAGAPCAAFEDALEQIESHPDPYHRLSVERVSVPEPGPAEDAAACNGLDGRRKALAQSLADQFPDAKMQVPADYAKAARKKKRGRRGLLGRIFR